jgi:hypothetical protein
MAYSFRPNQWRENIQTKILAWEYPDQKIWRENIRAKMLAWKYSDENHGMNIFRPKYWREKYPDQNMAKQYSDQTARCQTNNREFTHVRRQRQDDSYQYNIINPIAQNKWIIKSISGVSDVVHALLTTAKWPGDRKWRRRERNFHQVSWWCAKDCGSSMWRNSRGI